MTTRMRRFGLYALLALVGVTMVGPLYWLFTSSLKQSGDIYTFPPVWWPGDLRWGNYAEAWRAAPFGQFYLNSLITTGSGALLEVANAVLTAYAFVFLRFPAKRVLFAALLGALMVPGHVTLLANYLTVADLGWINTYQGIVIPGAASAFGAFLLRQHMLTIPIEIIEAARADGAGHLRILFRVVLPLSRPMLITVAIVSLVSKWNDFIWPLIVTNTETMRTLPVGLLMLKDADGYVNWGSVMAATVFVVLPVLAVFFVAQRQIVAGLTQGAVKG
ncbi:carbohydrate ABC transporter permease [Plantactinospora soyae]|uniref:Multiple sugar transport system permease protein/sn-glycerol 3-phosphate transport system permease protein n=1 Tax=Plantactinospora soyae TaxID=1544732 RepID=A0A927MAE5_9ACTN|nr:carbohydrate ABC transporter permease [Plantactinospora soyae]MBE1490942.1 multiple sugar transport system permease protein/sn-glycerol 3-phosphate transport system permease protein [Plantactinospora soyae]